MKPLAIAILLTALSTSGPAAAQGTLTLEDLQRLPEGSQRELNDITTETQETVVSAPGAVLRGLDKLSGQAEDLDIAKGQTVKFGRIEVTLDECRYPQGNPSGNAYAYLVIHGPDSADPVFQGWMIASSPALNAMDDVRYDVWALRCKTS